MISSFFKATCVHQIMPSRLTSSLNNRRIVNGHFMLNVQSPRPFHSSPQLVTYNNNNNTANNCSKSNVSHQTRSLYATTNLSTSYTPKTKSEEQSSGSTPSLYTTMQITETSQQDEQSDDEDVEEMKKQLIWNVGPTPAATFTFSSYANDSENIKTLVNLGVDLSLVERKQDAIPLILKLNLEREIKPIVGYLCDNGIVDEGKIGWFLTKNPFILQEDLMNLDKRLDYLRLKKFTPENISRIINANPFWLSFSVTRIDRRLGFFQSFFHLRGSQVRELVVSGPKLITSNIGRIKDVTFKVKEEMGFTSAELVKILLSRPRIWREKPETIWRRFDYLHNTVKFSHEAFVLCPQLFLVRESIMKNRIGFLQHIDRAQFDPEKPNYVSFKMIYEGDDSEFTTKVAKSSVLEYNEYMKCL